MTMPSPRFDAVYQRLGQLFNAGTCPTDQSIGEVAAAEFMFMLPDGRSCHAVYAYVWKDQFDDVGLVVDVARAAGASDVIVLHVLHDTLNGDADGRTMEGTRAWHILVYTKEPG